MGTLNKSLAALWCLAAAAHAWAAADDYPTKPVRLVIPFAAGGGADITARIVSQEMGEALGQRFVVENRPGASNVIATQHVARAEPDGYTLLWITDVHSINEALNRLGKLPSKLPYQSLKDFEPVGQVIALQIALMASKKSGIASVQDLTARARSGGVPLNAGHNGDGSPHYLAFLRMQQVGGYKLNEIPYPGSGPAAVAVQAGEIDLAFGTVGSALQLSKSNRVNLLAVSSAERDTLAPDVPTLAESGYNGLSIQSWMGVLAPKGVPADRLAKLNAALAKALAAPEVVKQLQAGGTTPKAGTREQFGQLIARDADKIEAIYKGSAKQP
ncbi:tripartite tricarboxylate transporter substrate binding protein [Ramlibacter sp. AW1]|uniref:Tripartite tricarboxylate transporter substrate binding protein n=1 Tax=Ramlibacter aurantiacus TaxID=2801330 RepID=A0A936ZQB6_9BURK|nr:tripartite tricarboxylate transporter substrate-binding protein [Ramlibacter aurantiacus]MBL0421518.1 tripartite tricarboxylate transporter substrate binding protein [Ramlibacter aurantiacus]